MPLKFFTQASSFAQRALQSTLLPQCIVCSAQCHSNWDLCAACEEDLRFKKSCCSQCALPLPNLNFGSQDTSNLVCGDCHQLPKPFRRVFAAAEYDASTSHLIYAYKEGHQWQAARALSHLLVQKLADDHHWINDAVLIPVPCHHSKLATRGFAQALEISRYLSRKLGLPTRELLTKIHQGPEQKSLNREERLKNLDKTFHAIDTAPSHCLLIDDVLTTGATAIAASKTLIGAGATTVDIGVLARTPLKPH